MRQRHRIELDAIGVEDVKKKMRAGSLRDELLEPAKEWLAEQAHDEALLISREHISIAREAKDAAWAAARAAEAANKRASIALIIATISAIAAISAVIVPHYWK